MKNSKNRIVNILSVFFGVIFLLAATNHVVNPSVYNAMIPHFIPPQFAHVFAVLAEALVAVLLLLAKTRKYGAAVFTVLMIVFLPLHIWDVFRVENHGNPLIKNMTVAVTRLLIQFFVIGLGIWMFKIKKEKSASI